MPNSLVIAAAALAVVAGGIVQSGVGLGLGLIASPLITMLDPALMPGSLLVASSALPALILAREARHADWRGISWALAGRLAGTAVGVWVVATLPPRLLGMVVGAVVLAAIALTAVSAAVRRNRWTLLTAGVISGSTATATSIGGPPVALLYQREQGPLVRASLSLYFLLGNTIAVTALAASGHLPGRDVPTGVLFIACAVVGFVSASRLRRFLDSGRTRTAVLAVSGASATILIVHSLVG
jgi:uncharacterized membrane protein YfcA